MPKQPDLRVKNKALKVEHEKKYAEELETWRERKKYYDEVEYPEYKAEYDRREAAAKAEALHLTALCDHTLIQNI